MIGDKLSYVSDDRGASPAISIILVIGFVVLIGFGLFLFGQGLISGSEDPRIDANFELEIENTSTINMRYDTGDDFTSQDTDLLFIIGEDADGNEFRDVILYDGASVSENGEARLSTGMIVLSQDRIDDLNANNPYEIGPGTSMQIIWEPAAQDDTQLILDEVIVPDESTIVQRTDQDGEIDAGGTSIGIS